MHEHQSLYLLQIFSWLLISFLTAIEVLLLILQSGLSIAFEKKELFNNQKVQTFCKSWHLTIIINVLIAVAFFYSYPFFYKVSYPAVPFVWFTAPVLFLVQGIAFIFLLKKEVKSNLLGKLIFISGNAGVFFVGVSFGTFFSGSAFMITTVINEGKESLIIDFHNAAFGMEALLNVTNLFSGLMFLFLSRSLVFLFYKHKTDLKFNYQKEFKWNLILLGVFLIAFFADIFLKKGCAFMPDTGLVYFEKYKYVINLVELPLLGIMFVAGILLISFSLTKFDSKKNSFYFAIAGTFLFVFDLYTSLGFNSTIFYPSTFDFQSAISIINGSADLEQLYKVSYGSILVTLITFYVIYSFRKKV